MNFMGLGQAEQTAMEAVSTDLAFQYMAFSVVLGVVLMIIAVWSCKKISDRLGTNYGAIKTKGGGESSQPQLAGFPELILGSANVLFLCFGMTGIMILVNNNLARAFAIGAAIAVIRFRIKFDRNGMASTLFFGVLVGMACGVGQIPTAIGITLIYGVLQTIIITMISFSPKKSEVSPAQMTAAMTAAPAIAITDINNTSSAHRV